MYYTFHCELPHCNFHVSFSFYQSHLKECAVHSSDSSLFCKRSIMSQLNVQTATAENEEQYTLSSILSNICWSSRRLEDMS